MLNVGDWTRTGMAGGQAHVTFNLQQSRDPVVRIVTTLLPVSPGPSSWEQIASGADLRYFGLVYFTLPPQKATYQLRVSASTPAGCEDGDARPMTVVVQ